MAGASACCVPAGSPPLDTAPGLPPGPPPGLPGPSCETRPGGTSDQLTMQRAIDWAEIPAGSFLMGNDFDDGFADDGEGPARLVGLSAYRIGVTTVTNRQFNAFVRATGYITEAEQAGWSHVFYLQVPGPLRDRVRQMAKGLPWWLPVRDACWQRPEGPGSQVRARAEHPVVHVSWSDAQAFCDWAGVRLPTEAQWERAARGGLESCRFPGGDELEPGGQRQCQIWQGDFPNRPAHEWRLGPIEARSFAPNGFGLFNMVGNVWEWCADAFATDYHARTGRYDPEYPQPTGRRSMRGGSFLCHDSYCNRYRVAARSSNTPSSSSSNCGFRVVAV